MAGTDEHELRHSVAFIMRLYRVQAWGELVELVGGMMVDADPKPHSGKTIDIEAGDPAAIEYKKDP